MRNEIIEKASELGKLIASCPEADRAKNAADEMNKDSEAVKMLEEYNDRRQEKALKLRSIEKPSKEDIEKFKNEDMAEFEKLLKNPKIKEYIDANQEMENLVNQVNAVLTYFIQGGQEGELMANGGCGGDCSGCRGCH